MMSCFNILYLSSKPLGEQCFQYLLDNIPSNMRVVAAVSNADKNNWWHGNEVCRLSCLNSIPFIENTKENTANLDYVIHKYEVDVIIAVQYIWVLPPHVLDARQIMAYNFHNAKLPEYKGFYSCNHALINGDRTYTTTVHVLDRVVDSGQILYSEDFIIEPWMTAFDLYEQSNKLAFKIFMRLIHDISSGEVPVGREQVGLSKYYDKFSLEPYKELKTEPENIKTIARALYFPPFEPLKINDSTGSYYVLPEREENDVYLRRIPCE